MAHGRSTQLLSCRVPDALAQWVKAQAWQENTTASQFIKGVLEKERRLQITTHEPPAGILARLKGLIAK